MPGNESGSEDDFLSIMFRELGATFASLCLFIVADVSPNKLRVLFHND